MVMQGLPNSRSLIWETWSKDPIKAAVLRALFSCQVRLGGDDFFGLRVADALNQRRVCLLCFIYCNWRNYITEILSGRHRR